MDLYPVIIDSRPPYTQDGDGGLSLLSMPSGARSLLHWLLKQLASITDHVAVVTPRFPADDHYALALRASSSRQFDILPSAEFNTWLEEREPSDLVLFIDPRNCPLDDFDFAQLVRKADDCPMARFLVVLEAGPQGTEELAHLDEHGNIRRIQRYYDRVTRVQARGVAAGIVTAAACRVACANRVTTLARLRAAVVSAGIPSLDLSVTGPVADLERERGLLDLNEHRAHVAAHRRRIPSGFKRVGEDALIHESANVAPTAQLSGRVIVHAGATIERDAFIIGPAVIGSNAVVHNDAVVVQSVIAPGAVVSPMGGTGHEVVAGRSTNASDAGTSPAVPRTAVSRHSALVAVPGSIPGDMKRAAPVYEFFKRVTDFTFAATALLLLSPVLLVIALLVKLTSPGPVFFAHRREGRDGKVFKCYKFRTMVPDAHARQRDLYAQNNSDGPQFTMTHDPRVTPIGKWLRDYCIDELPQFINVLRGEMSLVGPRPSPFRENQICVPWRNARLSVRPGVTGLWQICRSERSLGDFHQWIHYDILYVRNRSFWLDWKIVITTILSLGGKRKVRIDRLIAPRKQSAWGAVTANEPHDAGKDSKPAVA